MGKLSEQSVSTGSGRVSLLAWVKEHACRNYPERNSDWELAWLRKITACNDDDARNDMLALLRRATEFNNGLIEMHKEFDTLGGVLERVIEDETAAATAAEGT